MQSFTYASYLQSRRSSNRIKPTSRFARNSFKSDWQLNYQRTADHTDTNGIILKFWHSKIGHKIKIVNFNPKICVHRKYRHKQIAKIIHTRKRKLNRHLSHSTIYYAEFVSNFFFAEQPTFYRHCDINFFSSFYLLTFPLQTTKGILFTQHTHTHTYIIRILLKYFLQ